MFAGAVRSIPLNPPSAACAGWVDDGAGRGYAPSVVANGEGVDEELLLGGRSGVVGVVGVAVPSAGAARVNDTGLKAPNVANVADFSGAPFRASPRVPQLPHAFRPRAAPNAASEGAWRPVEASGLLGSPSAPPKPVGPASCACCWSRACC